MVGLAQLNVLPDQTQVHEALAACHPTANDSLHALLCLLCAMLVGSGRQYRPISWSRCAESSSFNSGSSNSRQKEGRSSFKSPSGSIGQPSWCEGWYGTGAAGGLGAQHNTWLAGQVRILLLLVPSFIHILLLLGCSTYETELSMVFAVQPGCRLLAGYLSTACVNPP